MQPRKERRLVRRFQLFVRERTQTSAMDAHALIRRAAAFALTIALLATGGSLAATPDNINLLSVQSGHSAIVHAPNLQRLAVGDSRIAGVIPAGNDVVINGKSPGHTTVFLWMGGRRVTYEVTVTEQTMDELAGMVRSSLNEPNRSEERRVGKEWRARVGR